jgi:hypothetical protein
VLLCSSLGAAWVSGNHLIRVIRWSAEALPAGDIEEIFCVCADHHDRRYDKSLDGRRRDFHLILRTGYYPAACRGEPDAGKGVDAASTGGMNNGAKPGDRRPEAIDFEARLVYEWRVTSLTDLGIPRPCSG